MSIKNKLHRAIQLFFYTTKNPLFGIAHWRGMAELALERSKGGNLADMYPGQRLEEVSFSGLVLNGSDKHLRSRTLNDEIERLKNEQDRYREASALHPGGDIDLGRLCYALIRSANPERVLEIGVARGMTTNCSLLALKENGKGHLESIDLPNYMATQDYIGSLIREDLKDRWTLSLGSSRQHLPNKPTNSYDLMIIDGLHSYQTMKYEYDAASRLVKAGGFIIADDIEWNSAFYEFQNRFDKSWIFLKTSGIGRFGLVEL